MRVFQAKILLFSVLLFPVTVLADRQLRSEADGTFWVNISDGNMTWAQDFEFGETYLSGCRFDRPQFLVAESKRWWRPRAYFSLAIEEEKIQLRELWLEKGAVLANKGNLSPTINSSSGTLRREDLGNSRQSMYIAVKADIANDDNSFKSVEIWLDGNFSRLSVDEDLSSRLCSE